MRAPAAAQHPLQLRACSTCASAAKAAAAQPPLAYALHHPLLPAEFKRELAKSIKKVDPKKAGKAFNKAGESHTVHLGL